MGKNIEEYKKYLKRQEMLGVKTFEFEKYEDIDEVHIVKYIANNETKRLIRIPNFACKVASGTFKDICQNIKLVGGQNLRCIYVNAFKGSTIDMGNIDTSNVEYMSYMFDGCTNLERLDLSNFDTSNVTDMYRMFYGCTNLKKLDLGSFDTGRVTSMYRMFYGCTNLEKLDLSNFDTSNVEDMHSMFEGCTNLEKLDLSNFDTSNVEDTSRMFFRCNSLKLIITNKDNRDWLERYRVKIELPDKCEIVVK